MTNDYRIRGTAADGKRKRKGTRSIGRARDPGNAREIPEGLTDKGKRDC
jgi:hypothetical protein